MKLLHNQLIKRMPNAHKSRLNNIIQCAETLINSKRLTLTWLGRHLKNDCKQRSNIRKMDRLLGNKGLQKEIPSYYKAMNEQFILPGTTPRLSIDWSCLSSRYKINVLRASMSIKGRGIVVYEETHSKAYENNDQIHKLFLDNLKKVLPENVKPIIITDAGFRSPWFKYIDGMGWYFVGRLRNNNAVKLTGKEWIQGKSFYVLANTTPKHLGSGLLTRRTKLNCEFIVYKGKLKNRKKLNKRGECSNRTESYSYAKSHKEPWLLVTNLKAISKLAEKTVALYQERMQIEENFRDTKNVRYGFGMRESQSKSPHRMAVLLVVAAIAAFVCYVVGAYVKTKKHSADYQAHSAKFTSVLSFVYLGCEVLRRSYKMTKEKFKYGLNLIVQLGNYKNAAYVQ